MINDLCCAAQPDKVFILTAPICILTSERDSGNINLLVYSNYYTYRNGGPFNGTP